MHMTAFNHMDFTFHPWPGMAAHPPAARSPAQHMPLEPPLQHPQRDSAAAQEREGPRRRCPPSTPPPPAFLVPAGDAATPAGPEEAPNVLSKTNLNAHSKENLEDLCKASMVSFGVTKPNVVTRLLAAVDAVQLVDCTSRRARDISCVLCCTCVVARLLYVPASAPWDLRNWPEPCLRIAQEKKVVCNVLFNLDMVVVSGGIVGGAFGRAAVVKHGLVVGGRWLPSIRNFGEKRSG